jgi:hypothetical protein
LNPGSRKLADGALIFHRIKAMVQKCLSAQTESMPPKGQGTGDPGGSDGGGSDDGGSDDGGGSGR